MCYNVSSEDYATLQLKAMPGSRCADHFESIRYMIGRLNHTMKAVKAIVATRRLKPELFNHFKVARVNSSPRSPPPLRDRKPDLQSIAGRMTSDPTKMANLRDALQELDQRLNLSARLKEQCQNTNWRPRVHAELTILDKFWTEELQFFDGDRYIGCSKPACFCCLHYIQAHPGRFVIPPSHNNNYINWKPPDIYDASEELLSTRDGILNKMAEKIRGEAIAQILERRGPARWRPDSLTEISTVRAGKLPEVSPGRPSEDSGFEDEFHGDQSEAGQGSEPECESEDEEIGGVSLLGLSVM